MSLWIFSTRSSWDQAGKECPECEENSFNFLSGECNSKRFKNPKIAKERSFCRKYVPFRAKWKFSRIRAFVAPGWYKGKEVGKNSKHFQYVGKSWGWGLNPISYPIQQYLYAYMYVYMFWDLKYGSKDYDRVFGQKIYLDRFHISENAFFRVFPAKFGRSCTLI